jgi:hypothetical protein
VAQRPDGKAAKTQATSFTRPAAERIARVVRKVEAGDRTENALSFRRVGIGGGGTSVRLAVWTATSSWFPISPFTTVATTTAHVRTIQFVFPTATTNIGTAVIGQAGGPTALCVNNMAFMGAISTQATAAVRVVLVAKEAGWWRLIGGSL